MDYSFIYKIILLTSLWNALGFLSCESLSFCFSKLKITNKRWSLITSNTVHGCGYVFCSAVLALNLATVSQAGVWKIIINPKLHLTDVLTEYTDNFLLVEDIFIFVFSFFLTHLRDVILLNNFKSSEFRRSILLILFFLTGYCSRFLGVTFLIGTISGVSLAVQLANHSFLMKTNTKDVIYAFKNLLSLLLFVVWMYLYAYLVPVYCLYPVMMKNATSVENRFCFNLFKVSFGCYYFAEIFNSIFLQNIQTFVKKFTKSYAKLLGAVYRQYSSSGSYVKLESDEKEETLRMYTAQGKSSQEIKRQMELMQMVKCVVAIRKKLKRAKENKEKLQLGREKK